MNLGRVEYDPTALNALLSSVGVRAHLRAAGTQVRDRARVNARAISTNTGAIIAVPGEDARSAYVDVGYDKHHPGFHLWWWEVGTRYRRPRPHLRPAVQPGA